MYVFSEPRVCRWEHNDISRVGHSTSNVCCRRSYSISKYIVHEITLMVCCPNSFVERASAHAEGVPQNVRDSSKVNVDGSG